MKTWNWLAAGVLASVAAVACSSSDTTTSGSGGAATGGTGGGNTGGSAGSATGGSAGATGGSAGAATGGSAGAPAFWTDTYNPSGLPDPPDGNHNAGKDCKNCHTGGGINWVFSGTIYGVTGGGKANVQVGVKDKNGTYTTYSATNGNFWLNPGVTIDWASAEARARDANGDLAMIGAPAAGCNSCHTGNSRLMAP